MSSYFIRKLKDRLAFALGLTCVVVAMIPLGSVLIEVTRNGIGAVNLEFLTQRPGAVGEAGGGIANAIQGTLVLIGLTCLIGVPIGFMSGIYLAEFGNNRFGKVVRFLNDVLAEFPSIVIGIFVYSLVVLTTRSFSPIAGATALSVIALPIISRTTEESMKLVPNSIREAAMALGVRRWRTIVTVVLSTARNGIVTGIMLSIARISGETAPLIMTILGSQWFFSGFNSPMDALPLRVWRLALLPYDYAHQQGWGAALVLIALVLVLNVSVRVITKRKYRSELRT
jgi:phosphate transport system permease protein